MVAGRVRLPPGVRNNSRRAASGRLKSGGTETQGVLYEEAIFIKTKKTTVYGGGYVLTAVP